MPVTTGLPRAPPRAGNREGLDESRLSVVSAACPAARGRGAGGRRPAAGRTSRCSPCARSISASRRSATGSRSASRDLCADAAMAARLRPARPLAIWRRLRAAASRAFGLGAGPAVLALAPGGPAERAGLRARRRPARAGRPRRCRAAAPAGDRGRSSGWSRSSTRSTPPSPTARAEVAILRARRAGCTLRVAAEQGCASRFQLIPVAPAQRARRRPLRPGHHRDRRLCRRRCRAGGGARPRIRAQYPAPPRPPRRGAGRARLLRAISAATRAASARPRSRPTGSASI